jgi:hypothetical protein
MFKASCHALGLVLDGAEFGVAQPEEAAMHDEKNLMGLLAKWKTMARGAYGIASRKEG